MTTYSPTPRTRIALFSILFIVGIAYIGAFAWFERNSVDFFERDQNRKAAASAAAFASPRFAWSFEAGSRALDMLGSGWQLPGDEATWSKREGGVLYLPASVPAGEKVEVRFDGYMDPQESAVDITLAVNGDIVGDWQLSPGQLQIVDRITLPIRRSDAQPWRLQFAIHRREGLLWQGIRPDLLLYGVLLRSVRTVNTSPTEGFPAN